jgi:septum formation protein
MTLILASQSVARRQMLTAAGVPFDAMAAGVDEEAARAAYVAQGLSARDLADALAELKATKLSIRRPGDLVLGCDQTLVLEDGTLFDKAADRAALAGQLRMLSGKTHSLYSAAVIVENGQAVWRHVDRVKMSMRMLSDAFIAAYIAGEDDGILGCVGGYRIEGRGAQLFSKIEGSLFTVRGLPLLQLLDYLLVRGLMPS